jgi:hypothetical protein
MSHRAPSFAALLAAVAAGAVAAPVAAQPLLAQPVLAQAAHAEHRAPHPGEHHATYPNLIGLRAGYLSVLEPEDGEVEYISGLLIGVSYERVILHEWLEIEVSLPLVVLAAESPTLVMPMDLHLKLPFHPAPSWSPYLATGPAVDVRLDPRPDTFFGASFAVGTYLWSSLRRGIDIEVDYNLVREEGFVHELLIAVGPVYRL